ncbi:MAG: sulfite exporter TauE/SafE family protein [Desulfovibrio sp.]|nr:sulfite exporter TauE/SafE family protein [Desulfovibrio sp.]
MQFAVSGVETSLLVPPLAAFAVSFLSAMGGISGAFLLLPFQMSFLGYVNPSVSATNQFYNVVAIPSGVLRYVREGRMVWPLTIAIAAGTLPGVFLGAYLRVAWLPDPRWFKVFAGLVLLYIGGRLVRDLLANGARNGEPRGVVAPPLSGDCTVRVEAFSMQRIAYAFQGRTCSCPTMGVFLLSLVVGVVGGTYGIGGGAIMAPFLVAFYGLPVHTIAGATLMGTFLTSVAGVGFYSLIAPMYPGQSISPDWALGLLFGFGGMVGMYLGARCQKRVSARKIKWLLGAVIVFTGAKYLLGSLF